MTYCLAWKLSNAVFFVADAAQSGGAAPLRSSTSSFGEVHKLAPEKVEQAALKVFRLPRDHGITFSGDVRVGHELVNAVAELLSQGQTTKDAASGALASVSPIPKGLDVQVALGGITKGEAELFVLDVETSKILAVPAIVQLGSLGPDHKRLSAEFLKGLAEQQKLGTTELLVSAMALVQSYGIHHALMDIGVGGHITGAYIDEDGWHWHPDLAFVLYSSADLEAQMQVIANVVRDDVVAVASSVTKDVRAFVHKLSPEQQKAWNDKWGEHVFGKAQSGHFEYVVFLDTRAWRVLIVEMRGQNKCKYLQWGVANEHARKTSDMLISQRLAAFLREPLVEARLNMRFLPFEEMP